MDLFLKKEGKIFRQINPCYFALYNTIKSKGVYDSLINENILIRHKEVENSTDSIILETEKIPFISYPYEWSFSQLKDAALLTINLQLKLLENGLSLKDASAYNVQFIGSRPIFIDTLSFEVLQNGPWVAFSQFCRHFLYPLMLASKIDLRMTTLLKLWIDGIPGEIAESLLKHWNKYFSLNYWLYLKLPNFMQKKHQSNKRKIIKNLNSKQSKKVLDGLKLAISSLKPKSKETEWGNYYNFTNYTEDSFSEKFKLVEDFIDIIKPRMVWDLGANNGSFSRLASNKGISTVSFDIDPVAVEKNYLIARDKNEHNILPILLDLANPSGGIGWGNQERKSLESRGPVDCGFALALIHHLAIGNNIPFEMMAYYFSKLFKSIIIEFIPKEDSKVQELLTNRKDVFDNYSQDNFENSFKRYFEINKKILIRGSLRTIYLMNKI